MRSFAYIDGCYRYNLQREWGGADEPLCLWIMLNPSTADADVDDPTIRRCIAFSREFGCSGILVVNLFAFRATDPAELKVCDDPIGPRNDEFITEAVLNPRVTMKIAAWGVKGSMYARDHQIIRSVAGLHHLGRTKEGFPKHPLYLKSTTKPERWT